MSSASALTTTDPGHAVQSDGTLKDALEIVWTYDTDEDIPFPSGSASGAQEPHPSGTRYAPAVVVAGTRQTTCVHRPSKQALKAAEASTHVSASTQSTQHIEDFDRGLDSENEGDNTI
jgi:hypothetical protein